MDDDGTTNLIDKGVGMQNSYSRTQTLIEHEEDHSNHAIQTEIMARGFTLVIHHGGDLDYEWTQYLGGEVQYFGYMAVESFTFQILQYFITKKIGYSKVDRMLYAIPTVDSRLKLILCDYDVEELQKLLNNGMELHIYLDGCHKDGGGQLDSVMLNEYEQEVFEFDDGYDADYVPGDVNDDDASDTDDDVEDIDEENGEDPKQNDEIEDDVASLDHLSPYESDTCVNFRAKNIEKKKRKGKKKNVEKPLVRSPTILEGILEGRIEDPSISETVAAVNSGYNTDYDSENHDSPVEDVEYPGELKSARQIYEVYNPKMDMWKFEPSLGMLFAHSTEVKDAIRDYAVVTGRQLKFTRNNKQMVVARCKAGCPFRFMAGPVRGEASYQIRRLELEHKCNKNYYVPMANCRWLTKKFHDKLLRNPKWKIKEFIKDIREQFAMDIGVSKACRTRQKAKGEVEAGLVMHYDRVWDYAHELLRSHPNSTIKVQVDRPNENDKPIFKRFYICFDALANGWRAGCRPVIGVDGCWLKGYCKGELLTAIGRDGNNHMYPIAWAVVDVETADSWAWFLGLLKTDLQIFDGLGLTIISDQQKGLQKSIQDLLPHAEHRNCARHIYANYRKKWKGKFYKTIFWEAAKFTTEAEFHSIMADLKKENEEPFKHLMDIEKRNPKQWSRAFFQFWSKCDSVENNMCETFNGVILEAREKSLIYMLEDIRQYVVERMQKKRVLVNKWEKKLCPKAQMKLDKNIDAAKFWFIQYNGNMQFEVRLRNGMEGYSVDFIQKSCSCRAWELSGIPCSHAIAAIYEMREEPENFVSEYYTVARVKRAYNFYLQTVNGVNMWKRQEIEPMLPPAARRKPGRPQKMRRREYGEPQKGCKPTKLSKVGRFMTCTKCRQEGHNRRGCKTVANGDGEANGDAHANGDGETNGDAQTNGDAHALGNGIQLVQSAPPRKEKQAPPRKERTQPTKEKQAKRSMRAEDTTAHNRSKRTRNNQVSKSNQVTEDVGGRPHLSSVAAAASKHPNLSATSLVCSTATGPTISSLAKAVRKTGGPSLGPKKTQAMNWLKTQT